MPVPAAATLAALLTLLLVALATRVSMLRMKHKVAFGDGGVTALQRAIRLHGNTAEHAPLFVLLALAYELTAGTTPLLVATGALFVVARLAFSAAMIGRGLHRLRMGGALFTYVTQAVLAVALLWALAGRMA